jgi:hypothetical protein
MFAGSPRHRSRRKKPMKSIYRRLKDLARADLYALSAAIDSEFQRRHEIFAEGLDAARRRAIRRQQSDRGGNEAAALPLLRVVGTRKTPPPRRAA